MEKAQDTALYPKKTGTCPMCPSAPLTLIKLWGVLELLGFVASPMSCANPLRKLVLLPEALHEPGLQTRYGFGGPSSSAGHA